MTPRRERPTPGAEPTRGHDAVDPGATISATSRPLAFGSSTLAAVASAMAGAIHVAAAVSHATDSPLLAFGFVVVGLAQIAVAVPLATGRDTPSTFWAGASVHGLALATWAVSRTVGLPLGHAGPESLGPAGLITVAAEVVAVAALSWSLARPDRRRLARSASVVALIAAGLLATGGVTSAVSALAGGHGHDEAGHDEGGHDDGGHDDGGHDDGSHDDSSHDEGSHDGTDEAGGSEHDHGGDDQATPARSDPGGVFHRHPDDSLHLHVAGRVHRHDDGTVHVHDPTPVDPDRVTPPPNPTPTPEPTSEPTPADETTPAGDGPDATEDHTHAPGEEH